MRRSNAATRETYQERVKDERNARADRDRRERRHDPVHARVLARPPEPERPSDERGRADHGPKEALLGRGEAAPLDDEVRVVLRERDGEVRADRGADPDADEDEAGLADVEPTCADENEGERLEHLTTSQHSYKN